MNKRKFSRGEIQVGCISIAKAGRQRKTPAGDFRELRSLEVLKKHHQSGEAQVELALSGEGRAVLWQLPRSGKYFICLLRSLIQKNDVLVEASLRQMQLLFLILNELLQDYRTAVKEGGDGSPCGVSKTQQLGNPWAR